MSSTNRSISRDSHVADYYITPQDKIVEFLQAFETDCKIFCDNKIKILDPCAGGDASHPMSYPSAIQSLYGDIGHTIQTIDIREDSLAEEKTNFLNAEIESNPDVIITNPPFNLALDIIKKSLNDVKDEGLVIMLLRLNFFGSNERYPFFLENMPKYAYVHHKRISFTNGATDSIEYMHAVWQKGSKNKSTLLKVI